MNLLAPLLRHKSASPYAGTASGIFPGASAHTDLFQKNLAPSAITLIRENLGTAYACGQLNSNLVAKTRLRLYVKTRNGEGKSRLSKYGKTKAVSVKTWDSLVQKSNSHANDAADVEEVTDHPSLSLLRHPNGSLQDGVGMSLFSMLHLTQLYQEVVGRVYWYIERTKSKLGVMPSQIWVLAPQYTTEWPGSGENAPIIEYYEFALGSGKAQYAPEDVVPFRMSDLATGGYTGGMSPLRACFEQAKLGRQADATVNARVQNGGKPDAMFIPRGDTEGTSIGRDEAARLELMLRRRYAMAGAGSIMVADIPGDLKTIAWPMNDVIDAARYELTRRQIAESYQVPMTKLNTDISNRASAEAGNYAHAVDAGLPRLRNGEAGLNTFLVPMYGEEAAERLFFAFDDPPGYENPEREQKQWEVATARGAFKNNELRAMLGQKDVPEGEQYLSPINVVPLLPDGKPDPAYYRGANAPLAEAEGDTEGKKMPAAAEVPAQNAEQPPVAKKPKKVNRTAKAMLEMAAAVKSLAEVAAKQKTVERSSLITKTDGPHEFSCLMAELPNPHAADILSYALRIPEEDLADDGRETKPHATLKYGLHTDNVDDVCSVLEGEKPINLTLGKTKVFPANENRQSDVIVLGVDSPDLHRLNAKVSDSLEHTDTYPAYKPHITVAYVKPGAGKRYDGDDQFAGRSMTIDRLTFSDKSNKFSRIRLGDGQFKPDVKSRLKSIGYSDEEIRQKMNGTRERETQEL